MKGLLSVFTRNWGFKLLALALALTVYYAMRDSARHGVAGYARSPLQIVPDPEPPPAPAPRPLIEPVEKPAAQTESRPPAPAKSAPTKGTRNGRKAK